MEKLNFKGWSWPENPETFVIEAVRSPEYSRAEDGSTVYDGLGELCRTISGRGIFRGDTAVECFRMMMNFMRSTDPGDLVHPVWGTIKACMTEMKMEEGSEENCIAYTYTFREVDDRGVIPSLSPPQGWTGNSN